MVTWLEERAALRSCPRWEKRVRRIPCSRSMSSQKVMPQSHKVWRLSGIRCLVRSLTLIRIPWYGRRCPTEITSGACSPRQSTDLWQRGSEGRQVLLTRLDKHTRGQTFIGLWHPVRHAMPFPVPNHQTTLLPRLLAIATQVPDGSSYSRLGRICCESAMSRIQSDLVIRGNLSHSLASCLKRPHSLAGVSSLLTR